MQTICSNCKAENPLSPDQWRCQCGGALEFPEITGFDPSLIDTTDYSLWRYCRLLGVDFKEPSIRLNAGWTPILSLPWSGRQVSFKLEYFAPTSSFKDRGTAVMINLLANMGVRRVVDDSSGNAGASVAAYAARAGIQADVFVPAHASPAKQAQIAVYGAKVHPIPGTREQVRMAAWQAAEEEGVAYASHAYRPGFLLGQQTAAWEIWEQFNRKAPDWMVIPVGQGLNLLGAWFGFRRLKAAGLIERLPRLVVAQPALLAPICLALEKGLADVSPIKPTERSVAEGLAIANPVRGRRVLEAIRETGGKGVIVEDSAIMEARRKLAHQGVYVEPTSATAVAALDQLLPLTAPEDTILVSLTGSGLKGIPS